MESESAESYAEEKVTEAEEAQTIIAEEENVMDAESKKDEGLSTNEPDLSVLDEILTVESSTSALDGGHAQQQREVISYTSRFY